MMKQLWRRMMLPAALMLTGCPVSWALDKSYSQDPGALENELAAYNLVVGTQAIGPRYRFTQDHPEVEAAKEIYKMGSNAVKIRLNRGAEFDEIVGLPFQYIFLWYSNNANWTDGVSAAERQVIYQETYDYTRNLLTKYNHSGKRFYLGHWEGDWSLLPDYDGKKNPSSVAIQGMIDWYNLRQKAIDAAKADTPHEEVDVYHYAEVNRVRDAMDLGMKRVVNSVLPFVAPDYVSYSAYDIQKLPLHEVHRTLDYVASFLAPKAGIEGKRVFIGEFGLQARYTNNYDPIEHEKVNREYIVKFMKWGTPFILYWEMYNNEVKEGRHEGFWLIDDKGKKWPLYFTFQNLYRESRIYLGSFYEQHGRWPTTSEYLEFSIKHLTQAP
jgi:hypothetical protein